MCQHAAFAHAFPVWIQLSFVLHFTSLLLYVFTFFFLALYLLFYRSDYHTSLTSYLIHFTFRSFIYIICLFPLLYSLACFCVKLLQCSKFSCSSNMLFVPSVLLTRFLLQLARLCLPVLCMHAQTCSVNVQILFILIKPRFAHLT